MTERLVATLGLLESRTRWTMHELAAALQVSDTTVRRSVARLREWGLQIDPLVLGEEEAAAVAIALRRALLAPTALIEEGTLRAMATLLQVLPARVRESVAAHESEVTTAGESLDRSLAVITEGLRGGNVVRFRVVSGSGTSGVRWRSGHAAGSGSWWVPTATSAGSPPGRSSRWSTRRSPRSASPSAAGRGGPRGRRWPRTCPPR